MTLIIPPLAPRPQSPVTSPSTAKRPALQRATGNHMPSARPASRQRSDCRSSLACLRFVLVASALDAAGGRRGITLLDGSVHRQDLLVQALGRGGGAQRPGTARYRPTARRAPRALAGFVCPDCALRSTRSSSLGVSVKITLPFSTPSALGGPAVLPATTRRSRRGARVHVGPPWPKCDVPVLRRLNPVTAS
jgi:hypothetical protein